MIIIPKDVVQNPLPKNHKAGSRKKHHSSLPESITVQEQLLGHSGYDSQGMIHCRREYCGKCTIDGIDTVSLERGDRCLDKISKLSVSIKEVD